MAKVKNKRNSGLADKVHGKKKMDGIKKKMNPFEVHINREKMKVLGKKSKHERGLPGVSRAKAVQKRKETLGTEMKLMNKTNAFIDRRIGEKNNQLSVEDRMIARFAAERAKQHSKKNIYNLADDEMLTHRGQTLEQIEKFDDPRSSDDEDDGGKKFGGLDDDFVSEGHFGGGVLSKSEKDGAKSHKDLIEQLIAESKKRKAEKQKEKEQTLDLTEKLDSEWKDLQPVVFKRARVEEKQESVIDKLLSQAEKKSEDYDKMMRELKFEKRGTPSDGLKSNEKQEKEERLRLEQLERERHQRMLGESETAASTVPNTAPKHRSADDLDDNFEMDDGQDFMLAYDKDGKPLVPEHILKDYSVPKPMFYNDNEADGSDEDEENEVDSDETDDDSDSGSEGDDEADKSVSKSKMDNEVKSKSKKRNNDNEVDESDDEDESDSEADTKGDESVQKPKFVKMKRKSGKGNDNQADDSDDDEETEINSNKTDEDSDSGSEVNNKGDESVSKSKSRAISKPKVDEVKRKRENNIQKTNEDETDDTDDDEENESTSNKGDEDKFEDLKESISDAESDDDTEDNEEIGSYFDLKADGENLKELLTGKTPSQQSIALQKLIKSYDPSLAENNKELLSRLYAHMLQYINDIFFGLDNEGDVLKSFLIFDKLAPHFYDLAHTNKVSSKKFIVELLKEKYDRFKKNPRKVPDLDTLVFFKLISLLYPTSDYRHPVTTPSLIFMSEILALSKFKDAFSVSRGLFITGLILEYTSMSKRFIPSSINFLRGILYLSANTSILNPIQVVPPFRLHKDAKILNLEHDCRKMEVENKMAAKDLVLKVIDDDFKIRCLLVSTMMLKEVFNNCNNLDAQECMFKPHLKLLDRIDLELYPKKVNSIISEVIQHMKASLEVKTYTPLTREKKKPKALRLYEPDIQEVFTGSKSSKLPREQAERARLQNKVKKEMKGALREIRRDKAYIASVKIRQKIQSDNLRKEKVKQIYKEASIQQGELNKLKRMK